MMKTDTVILPGINSIGWVDCRDLVPDVALYGTTGLRVPVAAFVNELPFFGEPECVCTTEHTHKGRRDSVTLEFVSDRCIPSGIEPAFVLRTVQGGVYLIGSREAPRPFVELSRGFGSVTGGKEGVHYKVTHVAVCSLIPCIA